MNWRIQNKILIPIMLVSVVGIAAATYFNIRGLVENENRRIQSQVDELFDTLSETSFPLQPSVLMQVEQISGIHLLVAIDDELNSSFADANVAELFALVEQMDSVQQGNAKTSSIVQFDDREYAVYWRKVPARELEIIAFYPRDELFAAIRKVVYPQLISSLITATIICLLVIVITRSVTSPIQRLKDHVQRIAEGDFSEQKLERKDEVGELFQSINEMAEKLKLYEQRIRAQEKLLTLDQMGGGIAHQMRNSITGCRLALDLHRQSCQSDAESLDVAIRQLTFMEDFQKRFLSFAKESSREKSKMDLAATVRQYCQLLEPFAKHVQVEFKVNVPDDPKWICGNENMIQQLVGNLVTNAIEAASTNQEADHKLVEVEIQEIDDCPTLRVRDSGEGISPKVDQRLFEPLVSTKPDGVGLGLAIVKQTVDDHGATIKWSREQSLTQFVVTFPQHSNPDQKVE